MVSLTFLNNVAVNGGAVSAL
ncbi:MAG: hypothetical protein EAZ53_16310 [Bacteroidetes bacterium]|nr:MAG: hypothetical protein EAZ53_16310 [Bacteroidota bacterium]